MDDRQRDGGRPRDSDPSDMTDFEKNVAHGELEAIEEDEQADRQNRAPERSPADVAKDGS